VLTSRCRRHHTVIDWKHLTGTFTFGSGPTKAELDEIIRQSLLLWT
jgi:hypothetical protein